MNYPVITETCYLLARDSGINAQCAFLDDLAEEVFAVFELQPPQIRRTIELMKRYADLPMDFADASIDRRASRTPGSWADFDGRSTRLQHLSLEQQQSF